MVGACFYAVVFSSFHLAFSLSVLHLPSYLHPYEVILNMDFVSSVFILSFFYFDLLAGILYACLVASFHLDNYWSYDVKGSTFGLWSKIKSIGKRGLYTNKKCMKNIHWNCALCSFKQKSIYFCGHSRLPSLCLLRFSTYCRS